MLRNTLNTFITATLIMLLGVSSSAQAIVPMGDLMGTTSVTFGEGDEAVTYSSVLKIDFVPKAPVLSEIEPQILGDTDSATATFWITSRANGPADYTLASEVALTNLETEPDVTFELQDGAPDNIVNLGATAVVKVNEGLLVVPSDGAADAEVNGIEATDKVMIDNLEYTVEAVEDNGAIATITLQGGLGEANPSMGTPIWEKQEVTVTLDSIGSAPEEGPSNVTVTVRASIGGLIGDTTFIATRTVEVLPWARTYVRNTDEGENPADEVAATLPEENAYLVDGTWYFSSLAGADSEEGLAGEAVLVIEAAQVRAAAGDTLEYVIVVSAGNTQPEQEFTIVETFPPYAIDPRPVSVREYTADAVWTDWLAQALGDDMGEWFSDTQVTWDWAFGEFPAQQTIALTYTLQLGEAEEVVSEVLVEGGVSPEVTTSEPGTPWRESFTMLAVDTACWCDGPRSPVDYCTVEGWAAGVNGWALEDDNQSTVRRMVDDGAGLFAVASHLAGWEVRSLGVGWVKRLYCR